MKTELLAALAQLETGYSALSDQINALPDDAPSAPTGLAVIATSMNGGALFFQLGWDDLPAGVTGELSVKGAPGNPAGPQEWTPIEINGIVGADGTKATYPLYNPAGQVIIFRLRAYQGSSGPSAELLLPVNADDYPPS